MKAIEQYFHVVLFIMLYKVVLTFKSVVDTIVCENSNESYQVVLSRGTACFLKFSNMKFAVVYAERRFYYQ